MSDMNHMLSEEELQELTGTQQPARQAGVLDNHGIFYVRRLDGRIRVTWYSVNHPGARAASNEPDYGAIHG